MMATLAGDAVVIAFTRRGEQALKLLAQSLVDATELTPMGQPTPPPVPGPRCGVGNRFHGCLTHRDH